MAGIGLVEDRELIVHREATPAGFGHHFRVACHDQGGPGGLSQRRRGASPYGSLGLATLARAHLRGCHHGKQLPAGTDAFHERDLSALYSNLSKSRCLIYIGTEGKLLTRAQ